MCGLLRYEILTTKQIAQIFPPKITDGGNTLFVKANY